MGQLMYTEKKSGAKGAVLKNGATLEGAVFSLKGMGHLWVFGTDRKPVTSIVFTEYGFPSGNHLIGILHIHLMIYLPECF